MIQTLTITQHNVMHWKTNKDSLLTCYAQIDSDIILINSHGLNSTELLKIPGYRIHKINSSESRNDGSAIAIKFNIQHKLFDDFDTDVLAIQVETVLGPIIIATMYLPPRRPYLPFTDFYRLLNNTIPTYILGDFNGRHKYFGNNNNNTVGKSLIQLVNQGILMHLGPHFPTFISHGAATTPDKIFANKHHYLNTICEPGNITTSDHIPIILQISTMPFIIQQPPVYKYHKADWDAFQKILDSKIHISNMDHSNIQQIDTELDKWMDTVVHTMDKVIPKTNFKRSYQLKITPEIQQLQRIFNDLKRNAEVNGWTLDNYQQYLMIRTALKGKCKESFNKNWEDKLNSIIEGSKDSKSFWSKIKILKGKNGAYTNYMVDEDGNKFYTDKEKCNIMEKTWKDVFRITEEEEVLFDAAHSEHINSYINIYHHRINPFPNVELNRLDNDDFHTREIDITEIKRYIKRSKNKAPGDSRINKLTLEKCTDKTLQQLTNIFNASFSAGYFPSRFKKAIIKFIPKTNKSPKYPLNYRPISLLEVPGKMYERIILGRLNTFLAENNIIKDRQHGFRPQKGTTTAITIIYETIANALANKHRVLVVLRDVAKAFDKVWHNGLKYKILQLNLPTNLEKTLCNFLDYREARISIGDAHSNTIRLHSGVPQGSVLSPTLYTLFTNDIPKAGPGCTDVMYADDITQVITSPSKSKNMLKLKAEREIDKINRFEKKWKIKTSEEKFKIIPLAQHKTMNLMVNGKLIKSCNQGKVLGLKLQSTGIVGHSSNVKNKGNATLSTLRRFTNLTPKLKTTLVKTQLIPILEYPPIPLCSVSKTQKHNLQIIINKALRFISKNESDRAKMEDLHIKYNITPLNVSLHAKASKIWEKIRLTEPDLYNNLTTPPMYKHSWFPKTSNVIDSPPPEPRYTS